MSSFSGRLAMFVLALLTAKFEFIQGFSFNSVKITSGSKLAFKPPNYLRLHARRPNLYANCHHGHESLLVHIGTSLPDAWFKTLGIPSASPLLQVIFLASNLAYLVAAVKTMQHRTSPKRRAAAALALVSIVSFTFHRHQCVLGIRQAITFWFVSNVKMSGSEDTFHFSLLKAYFQ